MESNGANSTRLAQQACMVSCRDAPFNFKGYVKPFFVHNAFVNSS